MVVNVVRRAQHRNTNNTCDCNRAIMLISDGLSEVPEPLENNTWNERWNARGDASLAERYHNYSVLENATPSDPRSWEAWAKLKFGNHPVRCVALPPVPSRPGECTFLSRSHGAARPHLSRPTSHMLLSHLSCLVHSCRVPPLASHFGAYAELRARRCASSRTSSGASSPTPTT